MPTPGYTVLDLHAICTRRFGRFRTLAGGMLALLACTAAAAVVVGQQGTPAPSSEVIALRAQLDAMRQYQDQFVSIVLWSLGVVFAISLALAAFSWWTNKTNYDRDRAALAQERDAMRHELRALVSDEIRRVSQETTATLTQRQTAIQQAVQQGVEKSLTGRINDLTKTLNEWAEATLELRSDLVERDAKDALRDNRHTWALYKYCEYLGLSVERKADHYEVGEALDAIKTIIDRPDMHLTAEEVTHTVEALKGLPARYQPAAEGLIQRTKAKQR